MNVYIGASFVRREEIKELVRPRCRDHWEIVSSWLDQTETEYPGPKKLEDYCKRDLKEIKCCDIFVEFNDDPEPGMSGGGRSTELGLAIQLEMKIIVIGKRTNVFHHLPCVRLARDWSEAEIMLNALAHP